MFAHLRDSVLLIRGRQGGGGGEIYKSGSSDTIISALLSDTERSYLGKINKSTSRNPLKTFNDTLTKAREWTNSSRPVNVTAAPRRAQEQVRNNSYQTPNVLSQSFKGGWQLSMQGRQMSISRCWISSQEGQILIEYVVCKIFHIVCKLCDLCRHNFVFHSRAVQDLLQKYWIYYPLKPCR